MTAFAATVNRNHPQTNERKETRPFPWHLVPLLLRVLRAPVRRGTNTARHGLLALALGVGVVARPGEGGALAGLEELRRLELLRVVRAQRVGARALAVVGPRVAAAVSLAPEVEGAAGQYNLVGVAGAGYRDGEAVAVRRASFISILSLLYILKGFAW